MEQLLSFLATVIFCSLAVLVFKSPLLFLIGFTAGVFYNAIRAKQKGWHLPRDIKNTH